MPDVKTKYKVRKELHHDGKTYAPGEIIELQQENADYLLRKGTIWPTAKLEKAPEEQVEQQAAAQEVNTDGGEA